MGSQRGSETQCGPRIGPKSNLKLSINDRSRRGTLGAQPIEHRGGRWWNSDLGSPNGREVLADMDCIEENGSLRRTWRGPLPHQGGYCVHMEGVWEDR